MLQPGIILLDPTIIATCVIAHMCAVGIPRRSSSLAIAAPQRVLLPQVEVRTAPATPLDKSCEAMARPILFAVSKLLTPPDVE
jgi:hypothetical protein